MLIREYLPNNMYYILFSLLCIVMLKLYMSHMLCLCLYEVPYRDQAEKYKFNKFLSHIVKVWRKCNWLLKEFCLKFEGAGCFFLMHNKKLDSAIFIKHAYFGIEYRGTFFSFRCQTMIGTTCKIINTFLEFFCSSFFAECGSSQLHAIKNWMCLSA